MRAQIKANGQCRACIGLSDRKWSPYLKTPYPTKSPEPSGKPSSALNIQRNNADIAKKKEKIKTNKGGRIKSQKPQNT
jgi:hypothetical protein